MGLLIVMVTIDIALSAATLMTFFEKRRREMDEAFIEAVKKAMKKIEEEQYEKWRKEGKLI